MATQSTLLLQENLQLSLCQYRDMLLCVEQLQNTIDEGAIQTVATFQKSYAHLQAKAAATDDKISELLKTCAVDKQSISMLLEKRQLQEKIVRLISVCVPKLTDPNHFWPVK